MNSLVFERFYHWWFDDYSSFIFVANNLFLILISLLILMIESLLVVIIFFLDIHLFVGVLINNSLFLEVQPKVNIGLLALLRHIQCRLGICLLSWEFLWSSLIFFGVIIKVQLHLPIILFFMLRWSMFFRLFLEDVLLDCSWHFILVVDVGTFLYHGWIIF